MGKANSIVIGIILVSVVIFGGIIFAALKNKPIQTTQYNINEKEKPQIQISETDFSFGKIKVSDIVTKEIQIKNTGFKDLELQNFSTSCDCTFAQLKIGEQKSPKFTMHQNSPWQGLVPPNQTATLSVIYEPARMPVKGQVNRAVFFESNDPQKPEITIKFTAEME